MTDFHQKIENFLTHQFILSSVNFFFTVILVLCAVFILRKFVKRNPQLQSFLQPLYRYSRWPLTFLVITFVAHYTVILAKAYEFSFLNAKVDEVITYLISGLGIASLFWLILNLIQFSKESLIIWANRHQHPTISVILPAISESLSAAFLLLAANMVIPIIGLTGISEQIIEKTMRAFLIATIGWIFIKIIHILESVVITQYTAENSNAITIRKINTQVIILKRMLLTFVIIITVAAVLMNFDSVKNLGAGILTTAGIVSAIGAFASQQSIGRFFSGLQLAFTQPIRIGDTIIVDNEFGQVEEINLSFVTVKLWDLRRLIKPTDYFTKNGVLNLTRESTQLLGTVILYCDYLMPVQVLRQQFELLIKNSPFWDKNVSQLDVTDITDKCMQIRLLMSAANADMLWKLRCDIREKIMNFIVEKYPDCLTRARNISIPSASPINLKLNMDEKKLTADGDD